MSRMTRALTLLAVASLLPLAAAASPRDDVKPNADQEKWTPIYNGKDLDGWEAFDGGGKMETSKGWTVKDGIIHGQGDTSHLFSPKGHYKNFRYRAEVRISDGGNSGMYFRTAKGPGFPKGYEAQVNSTHRDPLRTGTLYGFVPVREMLVPPDTWFTQEVEAVGNHIIIKVNGKKVVDFKDPKNTYTEGYFAFQQHDPGSHVQIRKVEVIELPDDAGGK